MAYRYSKLLVACFLTTYLAGCPSWFPRPDKELKTWFDVQKNYAEVLDKAFGGDNPSYRVVAATGPIYPLGTPLRADAPSPITNACEFNETDLTVQKIGVLPEIKKDRTFSLNLSLPDLIKKIIKEIEQVGGTITLQRTMELNYTNLSQQIVAEDIVNKTYHEIKCVNALLPYKDKKVVLVRGYIKGAMKASSDDNIDVDSTVKILSAGNFQVKYTDKGSFSIEDQHEEPRFLIISEIQISAALKDCPDCLVIASTRGDEKGGEQYAMKIARPDDLTVRELYGLGLH